MPRRSRGAWAGQVAFAVIVAALVGFLVVLGLDKADKLASAISVVVALAALAAPYLIPVYGGVPTVEPDRVENSGTAGAAAGGHANTGVDTADGDRPAQVARSGDATANGPGSVANTGVRRRPRP